MTVCLSSFAVFRNPPLGHFNLDFPARFRYIQCMNKCSIIQEIRHGVQKQNFIR